MTKKTTEKKPHWHRLSFRELLSGMFKLTRRSLRNLGLLTLAFMTLFYIFSQGLSALDVSTLKEEISSDFNLESDSIVGRLLLATFVIESSGTKDDVSTAYMVFIVIFFTLAYIWILRHAWAKKKTTVKEAFYKGMYPVIKVMVIAGIGILQLIPFALGVYVLGLALQGDILISTWEIAGGYIVLLFLPALWSFSMLLKTIFALIITTIPDMNPLDAYTSAKELIRGKRVYLAKHFLLMIWWLAVIIFALIITAIAFLPALTPIVGFITSAMLLPISIIFIYTLYRSLVGE